MRLVLTALVIALIAWSAWRDGQRQQTPDLSQELEAFLSGLLMEVAAA
jgi:threonine/homoserine/homoserine lactone efflux protein